MEGIPKCHVCDGEDYYLDAGFYFCSECHTQSLGFRESFLDYQENTSNVCKPSLRTGHGQIKKPKEKKKEIGSALHWTSWEGFNYVLKGMVEELIALGARPALKNVVLQLWATYLSKLEVAFISTTEPLLPKFGINQIPRDYMIIYGQIKERNRRLQKLLGKKKRAQTSLEQLSKNASLSEKYRRTATKMLCVASEYEKIRNEFISNQDILSQIDERLQLMETTAKDNAAKRKKEEETSVKEEKSVYYLKYAENFFQQKGDKRSEVHSLNPTLLTRQKLLAILVLALLLTKDDIQISDVMRWVKEGHLSYDRVTQFFPDGTNFSDSDGIFTIVGPELGYKSLITCVAGITSLIDITEIPTPDFLGLTRRYIVELELPSEVADHVERLLNAHQLHTCRQLINQEAVVMAFIIIVLKALLGLDGLTEHHNSVVARKINKLIEQDEERLVQRKLFVWDDWVRYIGCRKSIVMNEHYPTREKCDPDLMTPAYPYFQWWENEARKNACFDKRVERRRKAHFKRTQAMRKTCESLPVLTKEDVQKFPPTLTPNSSYLQEIRAHWCTHGYDGSGVLPTKVLTNAHALTSIDYLVHPENIIKFAQKKGVKIAVVDSRASEDEGIPATLRLPANFKKFDDLVYIGIIDDNDAPPKRNTKRKVLEYQKLKRSSVLLELNQTPNDNGSSQVCDGVEGTQNGFGSSSSDSLVLFTPYSDYWIYAMSPDQKEIHYDQMIEPEFSDSFRWLLTECSKILEMRNMELYIQLRLIENLCFKNAQLSDLEIVWEPTTYFIDCFGK